MDLFFKSEIISCGYNIQISGFSISTSSVTHLAKPQLKHLSKETIYSVTVVCLSWAALLIPYCHTPFFCLFLKDQLNSSIKP